MNKIFENFNEFYEGKVDEMAISVSKFSLQKYLNIIKKDIKAKSYDLDMIDKDTVKITYNTGLTFLMKTMGDYGSIIGYNTDGGDNYNEMPKAINSYKEVKKNIKLLSVFNTKKAKSATELKVVSNNSKASLNTVDVGVEDALSNYGIKELYGCDLAELKKNHTWILKVNISNAVLELNKYDIIEMHSGTWIDGEFLGMYIGTEVVWKNGIFTGQNGPSFHGKVWENGLFTSGYFRGKLWKNGTFDSIDGEFSEGVWETGIFKRGTFGYKHGHETPIWKAGIWENGIFEDGEFQGGTWMNGTWNGGRFGENAEWQDGVWNSELAHPNDVIGDVQQADTKKTSALLKKYLKEKYGYAFTVRTEKYSMGSSLRVGWKLGVMNSVIEKEVSELQDYKSGRNQPVIMIDGWILETQKYVFVERDVHSDLTYKFAKMMSDSEKLSNYFEPLGDSVDDLHTYQKKRFGSANTWGQVVSQAFAINGNFPTDKHEEIEPVSYDLEGGDYVFTYTWKNKTYKTSDTMAVKATKSKMIKK